MSTAKPIRNDRLLITFLIAAAGTLIITIIAVTGSSSLLVLDRILREGPFLLWWCVAAGGYGHWITIALTPKESPQMLRKISGVGIGFGVVSLLTLGLGTVGWLNTATAYGLLIVGTLIFPWLQLARPLLTALREKAEHQKAESGKERLESTFQRLPSASPILFAWVPILGLLGLMIVADCVPPGLLWTDEPHGYDVVEYHLQVPREWYDAGRITPLEHNVFSYLPMNVEMHYLLAMHLRGGPWAGMYLAQAMNAVFVGITIITLLIAEGLPAAIVVAAVPWMTMLGSICYVEAGELMWGTLALVWMMRAGTIRTAIYAGICAGLACGAKLTAVPMLVLALPVAIILARLFLVPSPPYSVQRVGFLRILGFVLAAMLVFSPWLIRTYLATGNPIFPEAMHLLGRGPFTEVQQIRWERSLQPAATARSVIGHVVELWRQILGDWRWGYGLIVAAAIAFVTRWGRNRMLIFLVLLQLVFWLLFTHLQGRFALLMLPPMAIAIGTMDSPRCRRIIAILAVVMCVAGAFPLLRRLGPIASVVDVDDFKPIVSKQAGDAIEAGQPIALIGDARAFWYQTPMSKLIYRTVFDVKAAPDQSAVEHWLDPAGTSGAVKIIDEDELRRLCRTYYGLPQAP